MSHRIIISSSRSTTEPQLVGDRCIEVHITYTPAHGDSDPLVLAKCNRLMKLMRRMEAVINSEDDQADDEA